MTKKDYESIAGVIREVWNRYHEGEATGAIAAVSVELAEIMEKDNPRFSRGRFLAACRGEAPPPRANRRFAGEGSEATAKHAKDSAGRKVRYSPYQPKTGERCSCKRGVERDNCPACEGTGQKIDFAAIRGAV